MYNTITSWLHEYFVKRTQDAKSFEDNYVEAVFKQDDLRKFDIGLDNKGKAHRYLGNKYWQALNVDAYSLIMYSKIWFNHL